MDRRRDLTDRISSARGSELVCLSRNQKVPRCPGRQESKCSRRRRRCLHVPCTKRPSPSHPRSAKCPGPPHSSDRINNASDIHLSMSSSRHDGQTSHTPSSTPTMTATLTCRPLASHVAIERRVASSPERALAQSLNGVDDKTWLLSFSLDRTVCSKSCLSLHSRLK